MVTRKAVPPSKATKPRKATKPVSAPAQVPEAVSIAPEVPEKTGTSSQLWIIMALGALLLLAIGTAGYFFYRNAQKPAAQVSPPTAGSNEGILKPPKPETAAAMKIYVNENDLVTFIELVDVNLMANTRQVVWFYSDNVPLMTAYQGTARGQSNSTPWMAGDQDTINRQISVVNGNYSCVDITKTQIPSYLPTVIEYAKHLCVVAVPPDYGKFSGYLSVWLARPPNEDETGKIVERLRSLSARIGAEQ
jgi:hypothetical protein